MTDQLETRLREVFAERAADVPVSSATRLRGIDYHPRTRRLRSPVAISAVGVAGTAGAVAAVISLTAGASSAFAGWSAKPTRPTLRQLAVAKQGCAGASLPLVLTDTRGPFTFQVYADATQSTVCTTGPSFSAINSSQSSAPVNVPADEIAATIAQGANRGGQSYAFADGRTGSQVSAVTLVLADGSDVTATVQNGWFVAWWPGGSSVRSAQVTTPGGVHTQSISDRGPLPPPGAPASGSFGSVSSSGSGSGSASGGGKVTSSSETSQP